MSGVCLVLLVSWWFNVGFRGLPRGSEAFIGARCIRGRASGQQVDPEDPGASGYNDNWLGTVSLSVGFGPARQLG